MFCPDAGYTEDTMLPLCRKKLTNNIVSRCRGSGVAKHRRHYAPGKKNRL